MTTAVESTGLSASDLAIDHDLADIALGFRFLLDVTPVNVAEAREAFLVGSADAPQFAYRALEDNPTIARERLASVAVENVQDPTLGHFVQAKRRELVLQLEMLAARNTDAFRSMSIELYGTVVPGLLDQARDVLAHVHTPDAVTKRWFDAHAFADAATQELDHYRAFDPDISAHVELRDDCSEVMVAHGVLLVPVSLRISEARTKALIAHEIGTHVLTYLNGAAQPLHLLAAGLAGYEESQEGLALLAEHLVGGLSAARLRQIAARVVAVHAMIEGATFRAVHESLCQAQFSPGAAFAIAMRVFRSGGLTKDAVYLRGLSDLLQHLGCGGDLDALWFGKLPLTAAPLVKSMHDAGALGAPRLLPRYLSDERAQHRLEALSAPSEPVDLVAH